VKAIKVQVERFSQSPIGSLEPISGHDAYLRRDYSYFAFVPRDLSSTLDLEQRTYKAVSDAHFAIGRLDFAVPRLPNPSLLVRPALRREAQSTSALEGSYATLKEVLGGDFVDEASRRAEVREVLNYVAAAEAVLELIKVKPICLTLIAELQEALVRGTRGDSWDRGQLRQTNVYIGERSKGIEASRFVPPPFGDRLVAGMSAWEKWINAETDIPEIAKAAIGHY
jgi:Fic family protein